MNDATRARLIATVDQEFAEIGAHLDGIIGETRAALDRGTDRTITISQVYTGFVLVGISHGGIDKFLRALSLAVVRLAEQQPGDGA